MVSEARGETGAITARVWIYLIFLLSGFAALLYQNVWQRALYSIYGINVECGHRDQARDDSVCSKSPDVAWAPNTPPCIVTIFSAASWLPRSVAAVQSDSSRHSKPRSFQISIGRMP